MVRPPAFGAAGTDPGLVRAKNEDQVAIADLDRGEGGTGPWQGPIVGGPRGVFVAVCDGCGGEVAGEVASRTAAEDMVARALNFPPESGPLRPRSMANLLRTALDRTNPHLKLIQKREGGVLEKGRAPV